MGEACGSRPSQDGLAACLGKGGRPSPTALVASLADRSKGELSIWA